MITNCRFYERKTDDTIEEKSQGYFRLSVRGGVWRCLYVKVLKYAKIFLKNKIILLFTFKLHQIMYTDYLKNDKYYVFITQDRKLSIRNSLSPCLYSPSSPNLEITIKSYFVLIIPLLSLKFYTCVPTHKNNMSQFCLCVNFV